MNEKLNEFKLPIAFSLLGLVLIIGGIFSSGLLNKPKTYPKESIIKEQNFLIKVDIAGAVNRPGVYALSSNSRLEDVIKKAGGFNASASGEYISKSLNLSQKISDGQKIYVPFEGESLVGGVRGIGALGDVRGKVGVNSASQSELESLPGVGPATALKIISARPYSDLSELRTKKAVSKAIFEKIKDLVDLN